MATLNNNNVVALLNSAYKQSTGTIPEATLTLANFVDMGNDGSLASYTEAFTKALIVAVVDNWFTDTSYRSEYRDKWFEDERKYGAIRQVVTVEVGDVQASHAWQDFESGVSKAGEYTLYLPVVTTKLYGKTVSWELPIAITYEQWDDAFKDERSLSDFVNYIFLVVDNKIALHLENTNDINRNNFMAEKISAQADTDVDGVHKINLLADFHSNGGSSSVTISNWRQSEEFLRFACGKIDLYKKYMSKPTSLFNTDGKVRFTPKDRMVLEVLADFMKTVETNSYSDTFHNEWVKMPLYDEVAYWQAPTTEADNVTSYFDFDTVSSINLVSASGDTVSHSGIVAFLADKWAIMHTLRSHRVAVKNFDPEAINQYYYQFRDSYMNNLGMNALVFTIEDDQ